MMKLMGKNCCAVRLLFLVGTSKRATKMRAVVKMIDTAQSALFKK